MKRSLLLSAISQALPAAVSKALFPVDTQRDGSRMEMVTEWLKEHCRSIYRNSVYCSACDHEIGVNPECPQCRKAMKNEYRQTPLSAQGVLA